LAEQPTAGQMTELSPHQKNSQAAAIRKKMACGFLFVYFSDTGVE